MQFNEWYEIHWRKHNGDSGVRKYDVEHVSWEELDTMVKDPDIQTAHLFRQQTIQLGTHAKAARSY